MAPASRHAGATPALSHRFSSSAPEPAIVQNAQRERHSALVLRQGIPSVREGELLIRLSKWLEALCTTKAPRTAEGLLVPPLDTMVIGTETLLVGSAAGLNSGTVHSIVG
eukprot:2382183-Amphidinium_carterae.2